MKRIIFFALIFLFLAGLVIAETISRGPSGPKPPGRDESGLVILVPEQASLFATAVKSPVIWLLIIAAIFWVGKYPKEKNKQYFMYLGGAIAMGFAMTLFLISSYSAPKPEEPVSSIVDTKWLSDYKAYLPSDFRTYTARTDYYDYNNPLIISIVDDIIASAGNEQEAVQLALDYIFMNVPYDYHETDDVCFAATGSSVIRSQTGQCDTQTIAVVTLLRGIGIAARPVGGCLSRESSCNFQMALMAALGIEERYPRWVELGEIDLSQPYFSRRDTAITYGRIAPRKGGLHAWLEYYSIANGEWVTLEPTAGEFVNGGCYKYDVELYPSDNDKWHLCVSDDVEYAVWCSRQ